MTPDIIITDNQALRDYMAERCHSLHLDLSVLSMDVTGKRNTLSKWVSGEDVEVTREHIVKALSIIGVDTVVQFVCTPIDSISKDKLAHIESIKELYGKEK